MEQILPELVPTEVLSEKYVDDHAEELALGVAAHEEHLSREQLNHWLRITEEAVQPLEPENES